MPGGGDVGVRDPAVEAAEVRRPRVAGDLDVAEPVVGEARLVGLGPRRGAERVGVGRRGVAVGRRCRASRRRRAPPRCASARSSPAGPATRSRAQPAKFWPKSKTYTPGRGCCTAHRARWSGPPGPAARSGRRATAPGAAVVARTGCQAASSKPGRSHRPAQPGVVAFAVVEVVGRRSRRSDHRQPQASVVTSWPSPVGEGDPQQHDPLLGPEVQRNPYWLKRGRTRCPATGRRRSVRCGPGSSRRRCCRGFAGRTGVLPGVSALVADLAAVEVQLVEAEPVDVGAGARDGLVQDELVAQQRRVRRLGEQERIASAARAARR